MRNARHDDRLRFAQSGWHTLDVPPANAEQTHLALQVAEAICVTEGEAWCREFGGEYALAMPEMACAGAGQCRMSFRRVE